MSQATRATQSFGSARWATARRARRSNEVPAWTLLSAALSQHHHVDAGRPDVNATVQLAAELTLSERRKFRYNLE